MALTRTHIELTLGIKLPLTEGVVTLDKNLNSIILYEQMLYEGFFDSLIKFSKDKWDDVVTTINDWKDFAAILGKIISDPKLLAEFSKELWKNLVSGPLNQLKQLIQKIKLDRFIPELNSLINKVTALDGWKKLIASMSIGAITNYILDNAAELSIDVWLKKYFSADIIDTIMDTLTDIKSYLGWLTPIIEGISALAKTLKPTINKFKEQIIFASELAIESTIKKSKLKQIIAEEVRELRAARRNEVKYQ